jgi:UDP-N-acetylmuramate--alanine ligase
MSFQELKNKINGKVHFIGIGGIGMSALALMLRKIDIKVGGSDLSKNYLTEKLINNSVEYFIGHKSENITDDICLVVKTSIIKDDNPEIIAAKNKSIPIISRAELLALVMEGKKNITIAGTHGKTSTTAMVGLILEFAGLDPTIINGGVINYFSSNAKFGSGEYIVAESDESDGSFVNLPTSIGAITNIEPEHLEHYNGSFEEQKSYFKKYATNIPYNKEHQGIIALCIDDLETENLYLQIKQNQTNIITYSIKKPADLIAKNITLDKSRLKFDVEFKAKSHFMAIEIKDVIMPVFGTHNVSNALAAIAIAISINIKPEIIKKALLNFNGVKRRFTKTGEVNGVTIIDDYAHHPTEIKAVLKAARTLVANKKVIAVCEPHKYSRVRDLFNEFCNAFNDADIVIVTDIYSASQAPIPGISQDSLIAGIKNSGHKNVIKLNNKDELPQLIKDNSNPGDMVICVGAGNITYLAGQLPEQLKLIS